MEHDRRPDPVQSSGTSVAHVPGIRMRADTTTQSCFGMAHANLKHDETLLWRAHARKRAGRTDLAAKIGPFVAAEFGYFAAALEAGAVVLAAYVSSIAYKALTLGLAAPIEPVTSAGFATALLVALISFQRRGYDLKNYLSSDGHFAGAFPIWNIAFTATLALAFVTKTTSIYSRGGVSVFYILGFLALVMTRRLIVRIVASLRAAGFAPARRVMVVGFEERIEDALGALENREEGVEIVSMIALRDHQAYFADDLALASAAVRMYRPDDVCLAIPWSRPQLIESCAEAFSRTPAQLHLGAEPVLNRFPQARVSRVGDAVGLCLTSPPPSGLQRLEKRAFDLVVATAALVALSPLLIAVAILIRLDSRGPALFRQNRYGFNQEPFRIFKFRSMTTMEDGARVEQAKRCDPRVTRIGRFIRRYSIDELPQLLNVLKGDMSLVGPRPHALAHDQRYVDRLARYARRHNVKPGITGWAQVHGHRGEIANDQEMNDRLAHDLWYVDHWSLWLDIKIVVMTAFSAKAHRNAF